MHLCTHSWTLFSREFSEGAAAGRGWEWGGAVGGENEAPGAQDLLTNSAWTLSTLKLCVDGRVLDPAKRRATAPGAQRDVLLAVGVSWDEGHRGQAKPLSGLLPAPSSGPCCAAVPGSCVCSEAWRSTFCSRSPACISLSSPPLPLSSSPPGSQCGLSRRVVSGSQASFLLL